jgi:hypothetical protein
VAGNLPGRSNLSRNVLEFVASDSGVSAGRLNAQDLDLEAAEIGMVVFADAIGDVDQAALCQSERCGERGEAPADGSD